MKSSDVIKYLKIMPNGCHEWQRSCSSSGYGQFFDENGKYWNVHVFVWQQYRNPINGTIVRHTCHNRKCGNIDHLIDGSHQDNWHDSHDAHIEASSKQRKKWKVLGVEYPTCRAAVEGSGISMACIIKYTKDGIFDEKKYLIGCSKGGKKGRGFHRAHHLHAGTHRH